MPADVVDRLRQCDDLRGVLIQIPGLNARSGDDLEIGVLAGSELRNPQCLDLVSLILEDLHGASQLIRCHSDVQFLTGTYIDGSVLTDGLFQTVGRLLGDGGSGPA